MMMLGRLPVRDDPRTLLAGTYLGAVSPPPPAVDWQGRVSTWGVFRNDSLGDCTCASIGHVVQQLTDDASGVEVTVSDSDVVAAYSAVSGYDPVTGANDNGADELTVLNYWRKTGVGGHRIAAYTKLTPSNRDQVKQAIAVLGFVYLGVALPLSAQSQVGGVWDVGSGGDDTPGSWGGHAIHVGAYDPDGLWCVTWGHSQRMTWRWFDAFCEEAYACVTDDFLLNGTDPQGFDLVQLQADLVAIGANQPNPTPPSPPPPPEPPPVPVPPPADLTVTVTDPVIAAKITRAAQIRHMTTDEYVTHRMAVYFGPGRRVMSFTDESVG